MPETAKQTNLRKYQSRPIIYLTIGFGQKKSLK